MPNPRKQNGSHREEAPLPPCGSLTIELPYSLYRVRAKFGKHEDWVSLSKNSQLQSLNDWRHQGLIRAAKHQSKADAYLLAEAAWNEGKYEMTLPLVLSAEIHGQVSRARDDDGAAAALYPARDGIAEALGIDDANNIRVGPVTFPVSDEEKTVVTVRALRPAEVAIGGRREL